MIRCRCVAKAKRKKTALSEAPTCNCLLLCDDVLESKGRGKHTLQGVIGGITVKELPATLGGYVAYVRGSNAYVRQKLTLEFIEPVEEAALFAIEVEFERHEPLDVFTLIVPVPAFVVEAPGRYILRAMHNNVDVASSAIMIRTASAGGGNNG